MRQYIEALTRNDDESLRAAAKVLRSTKLSTPWLMSPVYDDETMRRRIYECERRDAQQVASVWMAVADQVKEW